MDHQNCEKEMFSITSEVVDVRHGVSSINVTESMHLCGVCKQPSYFLSLADS